MKKRVLIVGANDDENRKVSQILEGTDQPIRKVANILYTKQTIVVPSAYLECPWMHKHIIALQQVANEAYFLVSSKGKKSYPPGFARVFQLPVTGTIVFDSSKEMKEVAITVSGELQAVGCIEPYLFIDISEKSLLTRA